MTWLAGGTTTGNGSLAGGGGGGSVLNALFGAYVSRHSGETFTDSFERFNTAIAATMQVGRAYDAMLGVTGLTTPIAQIKAATGMANTPLIPSFHYDPTQVVTGTFDAEISTFFSSLPTTQPTFWCYWHEMDGASFTWTPTQWAAAWLRIRGLALATGNPQLFATMIMTGFSFSARLPLWFTPVSGHVDIIAVDPYAHTAGQSASSFLSTYISQINALGGPLPAVAENALNAVAGGTTNAQVAAYVETIGAIAPTLVFYSYFNDQSDAQGRDDEIDPIPAAAAAYGLLM